jgi:hypothetical protein
MDLNAGNSSREHRPGIHITVDIRLEYSDAEFIPEPADQLQYARGLARAR